MIIKRYLTLLLLVFVFINVQANVEDVKDNEIIKIIPSNNDDIVRHLPVYRFCDNEVGLFINSFLSSLADFPFYDPVILISNTNNAPDYFALELTKLPKDCVLLQMKTWDQRILKQARGAIFLPNNKTGIILSDSKEWLEQLNIEETNNILSIYYGKSYRSKNNNGIYLEYMIDSRFIWAVLKILDDNKVNPLMIYNSCFPIQNYEDLNSKFDWIEQFYREHGLTPGCEYYDQENIFEKRRDKGIKMDFEIIIPEKL